MDEEGDRPNVVLTGFMGTGKSTCGRLLAGMIGYEFVDTDHLIEAEHGPIPTIFAEHGEARFREFEREAARALASRQGLVISTGGRLMLDPDNARVLGATGRVFCLTASVDSILARVEHSASDRPLLAGDNVRERIERTLADRAEGYAAFDQVDTEGKAAIEVARAIANRR